MSKDKFNYRDLVEGGKEAARYYKMTHRDVDKAIKKIYDGAPQHVIRQAVQNFYDGKKR